VRVIAGTARGRPLRVAADTRPTADLIKGSIFSMLEALAYKRDFEPDEDGALAAALAWPRVLDLFAGSGGLGIEALSRGAQHAMFVEQDRASARIIDANLRAADVAERAVVQVGPVQLILPRLSGPFDLVFADPPYADGGAVQTTTALLRRAGLLTRDSVVVLEQAGEHEAPADVGPLPLASTRRHGRTRVSLYAGW